MFSILVASAMSMVRCGLDRHEVKNTIVKFAKSFSFSDDSIKDLMKFVDVTQYKK